MVEKLGAAELELTLSDGKRISRTVDYNCSKLVLSRMGIQSLDLKALEDLPHLTWLDLSHNDIQHVNLDSIKTSQIQYLSLSYNPFEEGLNLSFLSTTSRLRTLRMTGCKLEEIDLSPLSKSVLENLSIAFNNLTEIDLAPLSSCSHLQMLLLNRNLISELDLTSIASCSSLRVLNIGDNPLQEIDLAPLRSCDKLFSLALDKTKIESIDLTPLKGITTLKGLDLSNNRLNTVDLRPLERYNSMCKIRLTGNPLTRIITSLDSTCLELEIDSGVLVDRSP